MRYRRNVMVSPWHVRAGTARVTRCDKCRCRSAIVAVAYRIEEGVTWHHHSCREAAARAAEQFCPIANALRGNVEITRTACLLQAQGDIQRAAAVPAIR